MEPPQTPSTLTRQDRDIADTVARERPRLRNFIRRRVIDQDEAEDILQDVFEELVEAWRLPDPIEQVGAWLFRVARNRIIDRFRKRKETPLPEAAQADDEYRLDLALPSPDAGPEAAYARAALLETLRAALEELPASQREVFIALISPGAAILPGLISIPLIWSTSQRFSRVSCSLRAPSAASNAMKVRKNTFIDASAAITTVFNLETLIAPPPLLY